MRIYIILAIVVIFVGVNDNSVNAQGSQGSCSTNWYPAVAETPYTDFDNNNDWMTGSPIGNILPNSGYEILCRSTNTIVSFGGPGSLLLGQATGASSTGVVTTGAVGKDFLTLGSWNTLNNLLITEPDRPLTVGLQDWKHSVHTSGGDDIIYLPKNIRYNSDSIKAIDGGYVHTGNGSDTIAIGHRSTGTFNTGSVGQIEVSIVGDGAEVTGSTFYLNKSVVSKLTLDSSAKLQDSDVWLQNYGINGIENFGGSDIENVYITSSLDSSDGIVNDASQIDSSVILLGNGADSVVNRLAGTITNTEINCGNDSDSQKADALTNETGSTISGRWVPGQTESPDMIFGCDNIVNDAVIEGVMIFPGASEKVNIVVRGNGKIKRSYIDCKYGVAYWSPDDQGNVPELSDSQVTTDRCIHRTLDPDQDKLTTISISEVKFEIGDGSQVLDAAISGTPGPEEIYLNAAAIIAGSSIPLPGGGGAPSPDVVPGIDGQLPIVLGDPTTTPFIKMDDGNDTIELDNGSEISDTNIYLDGFANEPIAGDGNDSMDIDDSDLLNSYVSGGGGNDTIRNDGIIYNTKIELNDGGDYFHNDDTTTGNDSVGFSTIDMGGGNDQLNNESLIDNSLIEGDDGNDSLSNNGGTISNSTINGNANDDTIDNNGGTVTASVINGNSGNDVIKNTNGGSIGNSTIDGNSGDDTIENNASTITASVIDGGQEEDANDEVDDLIQNKDGGRIEDSSIEGGSGNDRIENVTTNGNKSLIVNSTITDSDGDEILWNKQGTQIAGTDVDLGVGDDKVVNWGTINAASTLTFDTGNDTLTNANGSPAGYISNITIEMNGGADELNNNNGAVIQHSDITTGAGKDTLYSNGSLNNNTIDLGNNTDTFTHNSNGTVDNTRIDLGSNADTLDNEGTIQNGSEIDGGGGGDTITNQNGGTITDSSVKGGDFDDAIVNEAGAEILNSTIHGDGGTSDGHDTITNDGIIQGTDASAVMSFIYTVTGIDFIGDGVTLNTLVQTQPIVAQPIVEGSTLLAPTVLEGTGGTSASSSSGVSSYVYGNGGDDSLNNSGTIDRTTVSMGAGNDSVVIDGTVGFSTITGDDDADLITNENGGLVEVTIIDGGDGNDTIENKNSSSEIKNSTINGGKSADVITNESGAIIKSSSINGDGGGDTIVNQSGATIRNTTIDGGAFDDSLQNAGTVKGTTANVSFIKGGDGNDTITNTSSGNIIDTDVLGGTGDDEIILFGSVDSASVIRGDAVSGVGGNDSIEINVGASVSTQIHGDYTSGDGGNDTIKVFNAATVTGNISGDRFTSGSTANGGNDSIVIRSGGTVDGHIFGDNGAGDGGNDTIQISGRVTGDVVGDLVSGKGGIDSIVVNASGVVQGDVIGDDAGTPANAGNGGDDVFVINGQVDGTIYLDNVGGATLDVVAGTEVAAFDYAVGGNDVIVVAGQITGNIASASGNDGDDIFVIADGGVVGGMMDGGAHVEGDSLIFDLSTWSKGEYNDLAELFEGLSIEDGKVRYRGNRYQWVNFEVLDYFIQLFQKRTVPLRCGGVYKLNDEGTACEAYGQEAQDAIQFHRNNPGYDGRMPGTEACAIYNYGNAMRVYEVMDGAEGELVTTISADVFSQEVASNVLLASSASGHVHVYYLTSNEVQVECRDYTGKTQVRIIPDFSGTVNASFDKGV